MLPGIGLSGIGLWTDCFLLETDYLTTTIGRCIAHGASQFFPCWPLTFGPSNLPQSGRLTSRLFRYLNIVFGTVRTLRFSPAWRFSEDSTMPRLAICRRVVERKSFYRMTSSITLRDSRALRRQPR